MKRVSIALLFVLALGVAGYKWFEFYSHPAQQAQRFNERTGAIEELLQAEPSSLRDGASQNEDQRVMPNIEQLRRALKGRRAERKEAQASPIRVEEFHEDGTWSAIVEATIITKWDGRWDIHIVADGVPQLCTTVMARNSVQEMEPQTLCRTVKIHEGSSTISISDQMGRNIFSEYQTKEI